MLVYSNAPTQEIYVWNKQNERNRKMNERIVNINAKKNRIEPKKLVLNLV